MHVNVPYGIYTHRLSWKWTPVFKTCRIHKNIKNYNINLVNLHVVSWYCIIYNKKNYISSQKSNVF